MNGQKVSAVDHKGTIVPSGIELDATYGGTDAEDADLDETGSAAAGTDQWKQPCRGATIANITIATDLNPGDTLDGRTLVAGDRWLVKDQSTHAENGIYVVDASPYRAEDMDEDDEVLGAVVFVIDGTHAGQAWAVTNTAATIVDTDAIDWAQVGGSSGPLSNYTATTDPTVTDDSSAGYGVGSRWVNTSTDEEFVCTDATVGAAVWVSTTAGTGGGGDTTGHIGADFDGQGLPLAVGKVCYGVVPYTGTLMDWRILGTPSGNVAFDVAIHAAGALPVFPTDSIVAAAPPSMTGDSEYSSSTLTGWSTAVTAGDNYAIKIASATVEWASLTVNYSRP